MIAKQMAALLSQADGTYDVKLVNPVNRHYEDIQAVVLDDTAKLVELICEPKPEPVLTRLRYTIEIDSRRDGSWAWRSTSLYSSKGVAATIAAMLEASVENEPVKSRLVEVTISERIL